MQKKNEEDILRVKKFIEFDQEKAMNDWKNYKKELGKKSMTYI